MFEKVATEMAISASKTFFGQLYDDLIGYLKIYDYLKLKKTNALGKTINMPSLESYWYSILGEKFSGGTNNKYFRLRIGDVIKIKDVFMTEWVPKLTHRPISREVHSTHYLSLFIRNYFY
jgi:hypothetical protein